MKKVLLIGAYGQSNLGDEALLQVFLERLKRHKVTVLSSSPEKTRALFHMDALSTYRKDKFRKVHAMLKCDAVVFGGGSVLKEIPRKYGRRPLSLLLHTFLVVLAAKALRKRVIFSAIGVGPLEGRMGKALAQWCANLADVISVRDTASAEMLASIGVRKTVHVVSDPVLLMTRNPVSNAPDAMPKGLKGNDGRPLIGLAPVMTGDTPVDESALVSRLAQACDFYFIEHANAQVVIIPFQAEYWEKNDLKTAIQIKETSKNKEHIDITGHGCSPDEMLALIRRLDFLIGMRLHSLIFAAVLEVPFAAIEYEVKVGNLLDEMKLRSASISSNGSLVPDDCSALFKIWSQRDSIAKAIDKALPAMRKGAEHNFQLLDRALDDAS